MAYLNGVDTSAESNLERFKALTVMADADVDEVDQLYTGWFEAQFAAATSWIESRLRKRYAAPFQRPYVYALETWLVDLVTLRAFLKKGIRQTDEQFQEAVRADKRAREEITEAAGSVTGLFDLPLRANTDQAGIVKGGPLGYSEASPYVHQDVQAERGRSEDLSRRGS